LTKRQRQKKIAVMPLMLILVFCITLDGLISHKAKQKYILFNAPMLHNGMT